jgi:hypothetical protein
MVVLSRKSMIRAKRARGFITAITPDSLKVRLLL